jgi:adenylate cyclase class IV
MIEVEKKFQPTEEQLTSLLNDCVFKKEVILHDIYYDYSDYGMYKKRVYLRKRNNNFELKIETQEGSHQEIEDEEGIKKYFKTEKPIKQFIEENLVEMLSFITKRKKYTKDDCTVDVDSLGFGYKCVELELLVENQSQIDNASEKIISIAKHYGFEEQKAPSKRKEYFRIVKPEVYKELYPDN